MTHRIALGALLAGAGILAVPSFAQASTCTFDPVAKTATIQTTASFTRITPAFDGTIMHGENGNATCNGATTKNIDRIIVKGTPGFEAIELNHGMSTFAGGATPEPIRSSVNISVFTGTGGDTLSVVGTPGNDAMSAFGSKLGGMVDLDNDNDVDVTMTQPARITLHGGLNGSDRLAAMSVSGVKATLPVTLDGTGGGDTLLGGDANDLLIGGEGDDFVNSVGGGADVIAGEAGLDTAFIDPSDTASGIERKFAQVGKLAGDHRTLRGQAGDTLRLPLAWTHPKAWKQLRSIEALVFSGAEQVGAVKLTPAGKVSATGDVSVARPATKIGHRGKTVTADLGLKFARSLKGSMLSIDIAATDRNGHRQVEPAARSVRLAP